MDDSNYVHFSRVLYKIVSPCGGGNESEILPHSRIHCVRYARRAQSLQLRTSVILCLHQLPAMVPYCATKPPPRDGWMRRKVWVFALMLISFYLFINYSDSPVTDSSTGGRASTSSSNNINATLMIRTENGGAAPPLRCGVVSCKPLDTCVLVDSLLLDDGVWWCDMRVGRYMLMMMLDWEQCEKRAWKWKLCHCTTTKQHFTRVFGNQLFALCFYLDAQARTIVENRKEFLNWSEVYGEVFAQQ